MCHLMFTLNLPNFWRVHWIQNWFSLSPFSCLFFHFSFFLSVYTPFSSIFFLLILVCAHLLLCVKVHSNKVQLLLLILEGDVVPKLLLPFKLKLHDKFAKTLLHVLNRIISAFSLYTETSGVKQQFSSNLFYPIKSRFKPLFRHYVFLCQQQKRSESSKPFSKSTAVSMWGVCCKKKKDED